MGTIEVPQGFVNKIQDAYTGGLHFAAPISSSRTNELDVVRSVLEMLQGFSSSFFYWDYQMKIFRVKSGIYLRHLSQSSLHAILNQFMHAATCLQLVEIVINKAEKSVKVPPPTLRAFASSAFAWLKSLREVALEEHRKITTAGDRLSPTLLGLTNSLFSLCSGAEYLLQIVYGAVPEAYFVPNSSIPAADVSVHILDYLYKKLDEVCLVHGGEEEGYRMLLHMFLGSLMPYVEALDSWLFEGTLDDPFEEMFFYANKTISVDEADFWEKSYLLRQRQSQLGGMFSNTDNRTITNEKNEEGQRESILKGKESIKKGQACPLFIMDIANSIVSAGKSLQLIRHIPMTLSTASVKGSHCDIDGGNGFFSARRGAYHGQSFSDLTLSEVLCVSLSGLIGHGDRIFPYLCKDDWCKTKIIPSYDFGPKTLNKRQIESDSGEIFPVTCSEKIWYKFYFETLRDKGVIDEKYLHRDWNDFPDIREEKKAADVVNGLPFLRSFCPENPVMIVCQTILSRHEDAWKTLNLSKKSCLPALNDEDLRKAVFGEGETRSTFGFGGTSYASGFLFDETEYIRSKNDSNMLEMVFPFPTILPSFQENCCLSELLPFQKNSSLPSRILNWIQNFEPRINPLPVVIVQECLTVYIKKQVDCIGRHILSKLMNGWKLMDELAVLRAIYLLGSGDLLQHFLTVIFEKLDKGETWDDDFELNTMLQESIRNSADGSLLSAPESLIVSICNNHGVNSSEQHTMSTFPLTPRKSSAQSFGINGLELLKFSYKVSWPLELIANTEAIKKYNQVMGFLLKVKHAKFVLDKARRWMWKGRGTIKSNCKRHWLLEQKLLHFVDAFHLYVMDRVYHSAWQELCEGMAAACSLDEVIDAHELYLLSIQRQCFVVPDKLWALIASRINNILGLALDFYSVQQTLSAGAVTAIKAKCEMEIDRIDKQFDDCISFLLRVLSFKLNVGNFPHLADLVTRINYNYFYMSDSGNLKSVPSSENAILRAGRASVGRTDAL